MLLEQRMASSGKQIRTLQTEPASSKCPSIRVKNVFQGYWEYWRSLLSQPNLRVRLQSQTTRKRQQKDTEAALGSKQKSHSQQVQYRSMSILLLGFEIPAKEDSMASLGTASSFFSRFHLAVSGWYAGAVYQNAIYHGLQCFAYCGMDCNSVCK